MHEPTRYNRCVAYVLPLSDERLVLLERNGSLTEPVTSSFKKVQHEIVLILRKNEFTHVASGHISRGRITLSSVQRLKRPLQWLEMPLIIPVRLRNHARRIFTTGGRLPPKTGAAILAALAHLAPEIKTHLAQ